MSPAALVVALLLVFVVVGEGRSEEPTPEARARASLALAKWNQGQSCCRPAALARTQARGLKTCPCSPDCTCGCNQGAECDCDSVRILRGPVQTPAFPFGWGAPMGVSAPCVGGR